MGQVCAHCGTQVDGDLRVCPNCAAPIRFVPPPIVEWETLDIAVERRTRSFIEGIVLMAKVGSPEGEYTPTISDFINWPSLANVDTSDVSIAVSAARQRMHECLLRDGWILSSRGPFWYQARYHRLYQPVDWDATEICDIQTDVRDSIFTGRHITFSASTPDGEPILSVHFRPRGKEDEARARNFEKFQDQLGELGYHMRLHPNGYHYAWRLRTFGGEQDHLAGPPEEGP